MKLTHPLFVPFIALVVGICATYFGAVSPSLPVICGAFILLCAAAFCGNSRLFTVSAALFCWLWGAASIHPLINRTLPESLRGLASQKGEVILEGVVASRLLSLPEGQRFEVSLERSFSGDAVYPAEGRLLVTLSSGRGEWLTGDRLRLAGSVRIPRRLGLPGEFDYPGYLNIRGIDGTLWLKGPEKVLLIRTEAQSSFRRWLDGLASRCDRHIREIVPDQEVSSVLSAIVTGSQLGIPPRIAADYARAGVSHILSISGFHLGVLAASVVFMLTMAGLRFERLALACNLRRLSLIAAIPVMLLYLLFTGAAPATARSFVMLCAFVAALWSERETDLTDSLLLAAFLLLLHNPAVLFDISFQLSFISLWGIAVLLPIIYAPLQGRIYGWKRTAALALASSVAAVLATTMPVLATFHQASITGILANIVIIPVLGYGGVILANASVPFMFLSPKLASFFLIPAGALVSLSNRFVKWISDIPVFRSYSFGSLDLLVSITVLLILTVTERGRVRNLALCFVLFLFVLIHSWPDSFPPDTTRVTFLSVGQGESTLIQFPDKGTMLVDGGGYLHDNGRDFGERYLAPALYALGIKRIDRLVLTHPHPDHIGGLPAVAEQFPVGEFWHGGSDLAGKDYRRLMDALKRRNVPIKVVSRGNGSIVAGGSTVEVIWPFGSRSADSFYGNPANENSLVMRMKYGDFSLLMMGDAGNEVEDELIRSGLSSATVLKVGHHGSRTATGESFVSAVRPRIAVISVGEGNRFGLPSKETLQRLRRHGAMIMRTDLEGTIHMDIRGGKVSITNMVGGRQ